MKKYLISGIGPGPTGVGRLMSKLVIHSSKFDYINIYKFANKSLRQLYREKKYFQLFLELFFRNAKGLYFKIMIQDIKNSEVILIHPQSIGIHNFKKLAISNHIVKLYIMDNSFFCMKSYNYLNGECLKCLNNLDDYDSTCHPYPNPYNQKEYNEFLHFLKNNINKFNLFAQSESHKNLLHKFYGNDIEISVIGMDTGEFTFDTDAQRRTHKSNKKTIVFHNNLIDAKGFKFAYQLAEKLENYYFIFPSKKPPEIQSVPKHIKFIDIRWDNGLKEMVLNADLILCLSMWSAPIEGALVKSIYYNGNVAVMNNLFGFSMEIPDDVVLKLSYNLNEAINEVNIFMNNNINFSEKSISWLKSIYQTYDIDKLFR